ncbi:C39 family peptidase [Kurthia senegalensis]|uniref:C39 family peptidase n=1 Tax=Kurthia senegalensis TaxID=1033740 RepID=UPI000289ACDC|nr:C39 family peptidase [Kurthia senegalensis]
MKKLYANSQYTKSVLPAYRSSACGATTVEAILHYYEGRPFSINHLYEQLGTLPIGLFAFQLIRRLRKLLGPCWTIQKVTCRRATELLDVGEPIALKFDRYFTPFFYKKAQYNYHWTVLVAYEYDANGRLQLIVEDLGTKTRESRRQTIDYLHNAHALTFVQITPNNRMLKRHD